MSGTKDTDRVGQAVAVEKLRVGKELREKRAEKATWLIFMIYAMAVFFIVTVFELDGVFYGITAGLAEIFSGLTDTSEWVSVVKGSMRVILVGGFVIATVAARLIARQRA